MVCTRLLNESSSLTTASLTSCKPYELYLPPDLLCTLASSSCREVAQYCPTLVDNPATVSLSRNDCGSTSERAGSQLGFHPLADPSKCAGKCFHD